MTARFSFEPPRLPSTLSIAGFEDLHMSQPDFMNDLATAFTTLNYRLRADADADGGEALQRLVRLAVSSLSSCDSAAITAWPTNQRPRSLASTGGLADTVDRLQYELGEGPGLSAAVEGDAVRTPNLAEELRWPRFCAAVQAQSPVRGLLSFHIADQPNRTALSLYSTSPGALNAHAFGLAVLFAAHARVLFLHVASNDQRAHLETALATSRQIGTAIGILMNAYKITSEQAFEMLRLSSQNLNRKLRDVADDVTETGLLPGAR